MWSFQLSSGQLWTEKKLLYPYRVYLLKQLDRLSNVLLEEVLQKIRWNMWLESSLVHLLFSGNRSSLIFQVKIVTAVPQQIPKHYSCFPLPCVSSAPLSVSPCLCQCVCGVGMARPLLPLPAPGSWLPAHLPPISSSAVQYFCPGSSLIWCQLVDSAAVVVTRFRPPLVKRFWELLLMFLSLCLRTASHLPACLLSLHLSSQLTLTVPAQPCSAISLRPSILGPPPAIVSSLLHLHSPVPYNKPFWLLTSASVTCTWVHFTTTSQQK